MCLEKEEAAKQEKLKKIKKQLATNRMLETKLKENKEKKEAEAADAAAAAQKEQASEVSVAHATAATSSGP